MHHFERGRMNCVAAKIAQKICVLFQHDYGNAGARQQETEHHSRRTTAGDAATSVHYRLATERHKIPNGITMIASRNETLWDHGCQILRTGTAGSTDTHLGC